MSYSLTSILPFSGGGQCPVQYFLTWKEHHYYIRYRDGWISVAVDDQEVYEKRLGARLDGFLSDEETTVYLWEISQAIYEGTLSKLSIEHLAFCEEYPAMWAAYKKSQATVVNEKNKRSWPGKAT